MTVNSSEKLRFLFILVGLSVPHSGSPVNTSFNSLSNDHTWESLKELVVFGRVERKKHSILTYVKVESKDMSRIFSMPGRQRV